MTKKNISLKTKSKKQIAKEVKNDIQRELDAIPPEVLKQEQAFNEEYKKVVIEISKQSEWLLHKATPTEFAEWLIDNHNTYVSTVNATISQDFFVGETNLDKEMIILYLYNLWTFLAARRIDDIPKEVSEILREKNEADLLSCLHILGYV